MYSIYEQIELGVSQSFRVQKFEITTFDIPYHFHPEAEMVYFLKGKGNLFLSGSVVEFNAGDLFLFASNVPHLFKENKNVNEENELIELIVVQFDELIFSDFKKEIPEFSNIKDLLFLAKNGLKFKKIGGLYEEKIKDLMSSFGIKRYTQMIQLLEDLKTLEKGSRIQVEKENFVDLKMPTRLQKVNTFILKNYHREISLEEVSNISNMNKTAFCRYFKQHTRKTLSEYICELRVDYASKLLIDGTLSISSIGYEVGFNNVSYFIKKFKEIKKTTPKEFRQRNQAL